MNSILRIAVSLLASFFYLAQTSSAMPEDDLEMVACHASKATLEHALLIIDSTTKTISGEERDKLAKIQISKSVEIVKNTFPDSQEHLDAFFSSSEEKMEAFKASVADGDKDFLMNLFNEAEPCLDQYAN